MDIMQRRGGYKVPAGASSILGVEFSGTVAEVGKTATQWKEGEEVLGIVGGVCDMIIAFEPMLDDNHGVYLLGGICGIRRRALYSRLAKTE